LYDLTTPAEGRKKGKLIKGEEEKKKKGSERKKE